MKIHRRAFTLVETMLMVAVICLLAAIATPTFLKALGNARKSACLNAQVQLRDAISRYAMTAGKTETDPIQFEDKVDILKGLNPARLPCCPINNTLFDWPRTFGNEVECPVAKSGHDLPGKSKQPSLAFPTGATKEKGNGGR